MNILELTIKQLLNGQAKTSADLAKIKRMMAKRHKSSCPTNIELLKTYHKMVKNKILKKSKTLELLLRTRPIRSLSGIVNISVLTKPYLCPGKCIYCPSQKGVPKSYLNNEPAVMRAILCQYDPFLQTKARLTALKQAGHPIDKIELRIIGGTWSFYPKKYQTWFIKRCFDACNDKNSKPQLKSQNLNNIQKKNEKAKQKIIGLSIETRPDFINKQEIKRLRKLGVTMVELGVQSIYNNVLKINKRGHKIEATIRATKLLKNAGFKILYQIMLNLPGSTLKRDEKMFKKLFSDNRFKPDFLKIYPCAILKEAPLYKWWLANKYKPYTLNQLINLMKLIEKEIPYYVRVQRIIRDIPSQSIITGPLKISNLREMIDKNCKCIRCREIKENYNLKEKLYLFRENYGASDGKEIFLSFENKERTKLYSLLRLRITSKNQAIIRDLHTYGQLLPINYTSQAHATSPQHKGLGKKLIKEAERITKQEFNLSKIKIISGVGVRDYYRKLGYQLKATYMVKILPFSSHDQNLNYNEK
jgi:elongator complex protein 3